MHARGRRFDSRKWHKTNKGNHGIIACSLRIKPNKHSPQFLVQFSVSIHVQEPFSTVKCVALRRQKSQIMLNTSYLETMCSLSFQCSPRSHCSESICGHFATNAMAGSELSFLRCSISDAIKTLVRHTLRGNIFTSLSGNF